ncbi:MAG: dihydroorotase [Planctomycetota bacterium]
MGTIRIRGGRVIDPSQEIDLVTDLWVRDGKIDSIGPQTPFDPEQTIDAAGLLVVPGLIDMHVHLRDPGGEADETMATGTRAALESGFTSVACMPDTEPAVDNQAAAEFITLLSNRANHVKVFPVGAVTKDRAGEELAEMGGLVEAGAVAFTDSPRPISNADIMRRALQYAQMFDRPVLSHPEVPELTREGLMNEGFISMKLGMAGMPAAAEEIMVDRDIRLAQATGGRVHLQNLSTQGSVAALRRAKHSGIPITAEVCPHHFTLTEDELRTFDSNYKVNPPLRTSDDVQAMIAGLVDGTIDVIASGHSPWATEKKLRELDTAPFGLIGIETLLPVAVRTLVEPGHLTWPELIRKMTANPARILGIDRGTLQSGRVADVTIIDPDDTWTVDPSRFRSKSRNCPFAGWIVRGRAKYVLVGGKLRFQRGEKKVAYG